MAVTYVSDLSSSMSACTRHLLVNAIGPHVAFRLYIHIRTGATAVLLGRPVFFSLAVGGQEGVIKMLSIVREELKVAMALCGCQVD